MKEIKKIFIKLSLILFILGIVVLGGTYLLGTNVLEIIYNIDFSTYRFELCLVILGSIFYTFTTISGTILIALRKIKSQFYISIFCSIFTFFISDYLVLRYNITGGFYAYFISMLFRTFMYVVLLLKVFKKSNN